MQFYESPLPSENTVVAIRISHIHEYGVDAELLEYNARGIIFNKDLSRKRIRSVKEVVRIGQETAATVTQVSPDSIDLSIRLCSKEDIEETLTTYGRNRTIHNLLKSVAYNYPEKEVVLRTLYETVVWPIARLELDVYDTFVRLHSSDEWVIETPYLEEIRKIVKQRLPAPQVTKFREVTLANPHSLHAPEFLTQILHSLRTSFTCEVFVIAPPLYRVQVTGTSEDAVKEQLDSIETHIQSFPFATNGSVPTTPIDSTEIVLDLADIANRQAIMNLGTLGNVSEGKSTFVRALSKIATQRHKKEKVLNITIHLGYAGFKLWRDLATGDLSTTASSTKSVEGAELLGHYSFADCPGHEAYLATMLSGAAIMDAAALLIASNSPSIPQVQTQEHLIAAEIMGLPHIFVIQNKLDAVDPTVTKESLEKIRAFVKGTSAEQSPIFPMSAQREWGLEYALHHIAYNLPVPVRTFEGPLRMQLVRSFDINRPSKWSEDSVVQGGVIGGTIQRGVLHPGDFLEIRPGLFINGEAIPILTRVTSAYCDAEQLPFAIAGGLIGVGTTLDPSLTSANALAGQVAGTPGTLPEITTKLKGKFRSFDRSGSSEDGGCLTYKFKKHKEGDEIRFCVGSMTVRGRISKVGEKGKRTIKLDRPVCVEVGQLCSILRSNGSRELLDGVLMVEAVSPYKAVRSWDSATQELATTCRNSVVSRRYRVIPNIRIQDAAHLPTYECMLDAIESHRAEGVAGTLVKLPPPIVQRLPKKTAWINTTETLAALQQHTPPHEQAVCLATHFQGYLKDELCTTLTVKKDGQYILAGRYTEANCRTVLRKYMVKYHKCKQCGSCMTTLIRQERTFMLLCGDCTSTSFIQG